MPWNLTMPPFIHPFTVTVNLNFRQCRYCRVEEKGRKWGGGGLKGEFLVLSHVSDLQTPHQTRLPSASSHFLNPLDIFFLPKVSTIFFLIFHKLSGWDKRTDPHTFCGCLVYRFYTLHSSADDLSIDFDLTCLCSALRACGVGVGWQSTIQLQQQSHHQQGWDFFCVRIDPHLLKVKKFSKSFPQLWEKDSQGADRGGGERSALETRDKIKGLVQADMFCSMFFGHNSPWCSTITKSGKGWIITWHLNFVQLSFTGLCTEQMLHLESLKILCYLNPFQVCKMRNTCSRINTSIKTKPDLFKSLSPAR